MYAVKVTFSRNQYNPVVMYWAEDRFSAPLDPSAEIETFLLELVSSFISLQNGQMVKIFPLFPPTVKHPLWSSLETTANQQLSPRQIKACALMSKSVCFSQDGEYFKTSLIRNVEFTDALPSWASCYVNSANEWLDGRLAVIFSYTLNIILVAYNNEATSALTHSAPP